MLQVAKIVYGDLRRSPFNRIDDMGKDWKQDLKVLAVRAVKRNLANESDNHKPGNFGATALSSVDIRVQTGVPQESTAPSGGLRMKFLRGPDSRVLLTVGL